MSRPSSLLSLSCPALLVTGVAWLAGLGCAMSPPADTSPDLDPTLPGVDVGNDPKPVPGTKGAEAGASTSGDPGGTSGTDAGGKPPPTQDASAPVDAAPPPPTVPKPSAGEVLITEVMYATFAPEPAGEWLELHSMVTSVRTLSGLTLKDGAGRTHTIVGLTIAPGAYVVLARNKSAAMTAKVPSGAIAYEYGTGLPDNAGILLTNGATGTVSLLERRDHDRRGAVRRLVQPVRRQHGAAQGARPRAHDFEGELVLVTHRVDDGLRERYARRRRGLPVSAPTRSSPRTPGDRRGTAPRSRAGLASSDGRARDARHAVRAAGAREARGLPR